MEQREWFSDTEDLGEILMEYAQRGRQMPVGSATFAKTVQGGRKVILTVNKSRYARY